MNSISCIKAGIILSACCLIIATMIKCSTDKTPDNEEQGDIQYVFQWDQLLPGYPAPTQLRYCFYPIDGGSTIQMDYNNTARLNFTLPPARYRLLVFNCDADNIAFRNMQSFETAEAYIPITKAANETQTGTIPLYGIAVDELEIKGGDNESITFTPRPLVRNLSIDIKVDGIENVAGCKGAISGMPASISLSKQVVADNTQTDITFETTPSKEGVNTNILILGKPKEKGEEQPVPTTHEIVLNFTLSDGSTTSSQIDLGTSLDETNGNSIDVSIEASVIPGPSFTVKINHWEVASGDKLIIE